MAREIADVAAAGTIESSWGNNIRNRAIMRYSSASARNSAVPSPGEGEVCYLEDTNTITVYTGSAWVAVDLDGHTHVEADITNIGTHTHDARYYTETETDAWRDAAAEGVEVYRNSSWILTSGTPTDPPCNTESIDQWGGWSVGDPNRIYDDTAGFYIAQFRAVFPSNNTGFRQLQIYKNASLVATERQAAISGDTTPLTLTWVGYLDGSDYVDFFMYQDSGTGLTIPSGTGAVLSLTKINQRA